MKKFVFVLAVAAVMVAVVVVPPAEAQECWRTPSTCAVFGPQSYGYQSSTGQIHEWLDLAERGTAMVPKAVAAVVLTEKIWESRSPRPPVQPAVYYPPPPAAPPAPPLTGRLVIVAGTSGELFLDGESKGTLAAREVKAFDLPVGSRSVIMRTEKKVFVRTASVQPSVSTVINFDP